MLPFVCSSSPSIGRCLSTLGTILKDNWEWRSQIFRLAIFDIKKQSRGAVLSWVWFLVRPMIYIFCFWFALDIGLKAGNADNVSGAPYLLWLAAGIIPWFFMQKMIGAGADVLHRYSYLVKKIKFPLSAISTIYSLATMIIQLMLQVVLFIVYFACGQPFDLHLLQVPFLLVLMFVFWNCFSICVSQVTALSKDIKNLIGAFGTPLFWLSGVIFDVRAVPIDWVQTILYFNPITGFVTAFRGAFFDKTWVWEDPMLCIGFVIVFILTVICMVFTYSHFSEEVADVI